MYYLVEIPKSIVCNKELLIFTKFSLHIEQEFNNYLMLVKPLDQESIWDVLFKNISILRKNPDDFLISSNSLGLIAKERMMNQSLQHFPELALIIVGLKDSELIYVTLKHKRKIEI